jgi:hypothetical protein
VQRLVALLVVVLVGGVAHADLKGDVEKLIRANIKAVAADKLVDFDRTISGGRVLVLPDGGSAIEKGLVADIYGAGAKKVVHKVESLHVVVDAAKGMAWFHGAIAATFVVDKKQVALPMRISGIAADEGAPVGWKIEALMYARAMPDKELFAHAAEATRGAPKTTGEPTATKVVASWFVDGAAISDGRSKNVAVAVNGTGAVEVGTGAFAVKLVKAWESLKLWATNVEATLFANNELAFVRADVMMPVDKQAVKLVLGVVLAKENNTWRWVALSFTPAGS